MGDYTTHLHLYRDVRNHYKNPTLTIWHHSQIAHVGLGIFWVGRHLNLRCLGTVFDGGADKKMDDASTKPIMFYLTKKNIKKGVPPACFGWIPTNLIILMLPSCFVFFPPPFIIMFLGKHPQDFEDGYVESEIQGHEGSVMKLSWIKRHETFKNMMQHGICRFIC